jgi:hypothetical protein
MLVPLKSWQVQIPFFLQVCKRKSLPFISLQPQIPSFCKFASSKSSLQFASLNFDYKFASSNSFCRFASTTSFYKSANHVPKGSYSFALIIVPKGCLFVCSHNIHKSSFWASLIIHLFPSIIPKVHFGGLTIVSSRCFGSWTTQYFPLQPFLKVYHTLCSGPLILKMPSLCGFTLHFHHVQPILVFEVKESFYKLSNKAYKQAKTFLTSFWMTSMLSYDFRVGRNKKPSSSSTQFTRQKDLE